jgi:hypothetical protein
MTGAMAFPVRAAGESPAQMQPMGTTMAEHLSDLRGLFKDMDRDDALDYRMLYGKAVAEIERLRRIESAALKWRESLDGDGWTRDDILNCGRPGMEELMRALEQNGDNNG